MKLVFIFSSSEPQSFYFTKNKKLMEPKFKINGVEVPKKNVLKMFDILFDKILTWVPYLKNKFKHFLFR